MRILLTLCFLISTAYAQFAPRQQQYLFVKPQAFGDTIYLDTSFVNAAGLSSANLFLKIDTNRLFETGRVGLVPSQAAVGDFVKVSGDTMTGILTLQRVTPVLRFNDLAGSVDNRLFTARLETGNYRLQFLSDAGAGGAAYAQFNRSGQGMTNFSLYQVAQPTLVLENDGDISCKDVTMTGTHQITSAIPLIRLIDNNAAANNQRGAFTLVDGQFNLQYLNDAGSGGGDFARFNRSSNQMLNFSLYQGGLTTVVIENDGDIIARSIAAGKPVGAAIEASVNLETLTRNQFYTVADGAVVTVTNAANTAFPISTEFEFLNVDASNFPSFTTSGSQTIIAIDTVFVNEGGHATLKKIANNTWALYGQF